MYNNCCEEVTCEVQEFDFDFEQYPEFVKSKTKKEATPMNDYRIYLQRRVERVYEDGRIALARKFYLLEDDAPQTAKAYVERIQEGKYQLPKLDEDTGVTTYGTGPYGIIFRDPANVADKKGFDEAEKQLKAARTDALDIVNTLGETDALNALKDFQAYVKVL